MCGIFGAIADREVVGLLVEGLKRLEYRGYDSAGLAVIAQRGQVARVRAEGKLVNLEKALQTAPPVTGHVGVAHTRWATHGVPTEHNAHPHIAGDRVVIVHNGIIENYERLRERLMLQGYVLTSETDTEIVAYCIYDALKTKGDILSSVQSVLSELEGAYAFGVMDAWDPTRMIVARSGSPVVIGVSEGEHFFASDALALLPVAQQFIYLEEGDVADIARHGVQLYDKLGAAVERKLCKRQWTAHMTADKGHHRHFMWKEILEQPLAIRETLAGWVQNNRILEQNFGEQAAAIFDKTQRVQIVACGTSFYAGLIARAWIEEIAGIPCQVDVASEFRYKRHIVEPGTLFVTVSQSGETADTLAALRSIQGEGYCGTVSLCNVPESTLVRGSDLVFLTMAGPEIGVCSTKGLMTQLVALFLLSIVLSRRTGVSQEAEARLLDHVFTLPTVIQECLGLSEVIQELAAFFVDKDHSLFLGRGIHFPVALEGALKLKEVSYIHAEGYPAGELKHGPLALVDKDMPVVVIAPKNGLLDKLKSNIQEVRARGGRVIVFTNPSTEIRAAAGMRVVMVPEIVERLAPMAFIVPLQLLAYHVAVLKGTDVDQPRNLAKSVTVE